MTKHRAYRAAWLLDGRADEPRRDAALLVEDRRIAWVGAAADLPAGAPVHDQGDATLLPGLIDLHAHLVWSGGGDPAGLVEQEGFGLTLLRAYANARANLRAGVTTVVDLGSNWDVAILVGRAVRRGILPGPTVIAAGRSVAMTGGHDPFWANMADGPDAVLRAVRQQRDAGAEILKLAATGGVYGRAEGEEVGHAELSAEELAVAVREAHRFGLKVAAHAVGHEGIANCLAAGVDLIHHGIMADDEQLRAMVAGGATLVPTLIPYRQIAANAGGSIPAYAVTKARPLVERHAGVVRRALELGVRIGAGSDAGSPELPHPAVHQELRCLVSAGLTAAQAVRAATSDAAAALGLGDRVGTLEAGMHADVLAVDREIDARGGALQLGRARLVLKDGVEVPMP